MVRGQTIWRRFGERCGMSESTESSATGSVPHQATPPGTPSVPAARPGDTEENDTRQLHALGYAQELRRHMSGFSNFAVSFTIISILSGCLTLYLFGMNTGGPVLIVWGWLVVGAMTTLVGLA